MTYELIVRNRAQVEIAEIMREYNNREEGLGRYFLLCLDARKVRWVEPEIGIVLAT